MKEIVLNEIIGHEEVNPKTKPISINFDSVASFTSARSHAGMLYTTIKMNDSRVHCVAELYAEVRTLMDDMLKHDPRLCYVIGGALGLTHYIPKQSVQYVLVDGDSKITLVLINNTSVNTKMTMEELRKSVINVNF